MEVICKKAIKDIASYFFASVDFIGDNIDFCEKITTSSPFIMSYLSNVQICARYVLIPDIKLRINVASLNKMFELKIND
jgi:hypothetical protein